MRLDQKSCSGVNFQRRSVVPCYFCAPKPFSLTQIPFEGLTKIRPIPLPKSGKILEIPLLTRFVRFRRAKPVTASPSLSPKDQQVVAPFSLDAYNGATVLKKGYSTALTRSYSPRKVEKIHCLVKPLQIHLSLPRPFRAWCRQAQAKRRFAQITSLHEAKLPFVISFSSQRELFRSLQAVYGVPRRSNRRRLSSFAPNASR